MTGDEWAVMSDRISLLWPPEMSAAAVDEYWRIVQSVDARACDRAITLLARSPRSHRPDSGTLYSTALSFERQAVAALPPADIDPLSPEEHRKVLAEVAARQTAEHRRRQQAVVDLLRSTGYRVPLTVLPDLMATSKTAPEQFDRLLEHYRNEAGRRPA
jgi:hypothetical protein